MMVDQGETGPDAARERLKGTVNIALAGEQISKRAVFCSELLPAVMITSVAGAVNLLTAGQ